MANNRLLLMCTRCNSNTTIARLQVGMESIWLPSRTSYDEYEDWLMQHSQCGGDDDPGLRVGLDCECTQALTIDRNP